MKRNRIATLGAVALSAGLLGATGAVATPAQADTGVDVFLRALQNRGLTHIDPARAAAVGQEVCPRLAEPGQRAADLAGRVAEELGYPLGAATMFTGIAISVFCPGAVAALADGRSPIPLEWLNLV
ncbi:DUF732 domain-containing protein [uncultured Mycolicibacterium sp.]|uniref:DUF732 domain-containing protein n=1 Tax=uncultured Mycolicibacterium sp. TaxID=2320817 RepID=UPI00260AC7F9|nr:DUF732 domain-containing protein [uncultured Mycolicibacterium sp.]